MSISFNKEKLSQALNNFRKYKNSERFKEDTYEREERITFFNKLFDSDFNELVFSEVIKKLWAARIWGNKDYLVDKIIRDNNFDDLKNRWNILVKNKTLSPGERYEQFVGKIKGMGPSMITEIICYASPEEAGIWNKVARTSLFWLSDGNELFEEYKITGEEYDKFNKSINIIADNLRKEGHKNVNLLFVDYFLWETSQSVVNEDKKIIKELTYVVEKHSRHDETRDKIEQIGAWLGFETDTEVLVAAGSRVDVIWKARIANLGAVSYIFEVQDKGSIDSLIVNLQQAQTSQTVQKLIIASDSEQIEKIKKRIETLPEIFRRLVAYWNVEEIDKTHENLEQVTDSISKLELFDK